MNVGRPSSAVRSSAARPASPQLPAPSRTKLVNIAPLQIPSCIPLHSSAINNSPRAVVWLAGHNCLQLSSLVRHLIIQEGVKAFNCPGHGISFGKAASFRRVPSKQGPPKRSFLNFLSSVSGCAKCTPKVASSSGRKTILLRVFRSAVKGLVIPSEARNLGLGWQLSCRFPKRSTCGKHLEILWDASIDRILCRTYVCKVSRTVGFALVRVRLD